MEEWFEKVILLGIKVIGNTGKYSFFLDVVIHHESID
jgi:hypothetical protein